MKKKSDKKGCNVEQFVQSICIAIICASIISIPYWMIKNPHDFLINFKAKRVYMNLCDSKGDNSPGQKVLSYSLYGPWAKQKYWENMLDVVASEASNSNVYQHWTIRLYHDEKFPVNTISALKEKHKNLQFCDIRSIPIYGSYSHVSGREWRFLPIGDKTVDVTCVRDIDSPLLQREFDAVEEWLNSEKLFHCMRDHPQHGSMRVLAGLFCFFNSKNKTLTDDVFQAIRRNHYYKNETFEPFKVSDQVLLREVVWPLVQHDALEHDSYSCNRYQGSQPYPSRRLTNSSGFMGCKRPCPRTVPPCPLICRPQDHKDWIFC